MGFGKRTPDFSRPTTVFVTGGTGFIGTKLVQALVAKGHKVRCLSRSSSNKTGLDHPNITIVQGSLEDKASLLKGMEGCTQVYHLAAYAKNWAKDPKEFTRQNYDGMMNVFEAAREVKIKRVVFTSTIVTFGPSQPGVVRNELMPRITPKFYTEYEETKSRAEAKALKLAAEGFPVVIVNPSRVYGPGKMTEGNSVSLMIDLYDRGKVPVALNGGVNVGNYVLVDDLVQGHILAMEKGKVGQRYIIGGENISLQGLYRLVDEVSGKSHIQFPLPPGLALAFGTFERKKAEWFGIYPQITPGWVETFLQDWAYECGKAERELGYRFTPLKEGVRRTYEWILENRRKKK